MSKLIPKTNRCYFIYYPNNNNGYIFYCHAQRTKITKVINVKFLKNVVCVSICHENGELSSGGRKILVLFIDFFSKQITSFNSLA